MATKVGTQRIGAKSLPVNINASHTDMKRVIVDAEARVKTLGRPSLGMHYAGSFGGIFGAQN